MAVDNLDKNNLNKAYLINNHHYKSLFRYRFFYKVPFFNLLISLTIRFLKSIKNILTTK